MEISDAAVFSANRARTDGGALLLSSIGSVLLSGVNATQNAAAAGSGGVFLADNNCSSVSVSGSAFSGNTAVAGAVGFLREWNLTANPVDPCADCVVSPDNAATGWGDGLFSTEVAQARFALSAQRIVSGGAVNATVELTDGACTTVQIRHLSLPLFRSSQT